MTKRLFQCPNCRGSFRDVERNSAFSPTFGVGLCPVCRGKYKKWKNKRIYDLTSIEMFIEDTTIERSPKEIAARLLDVVEPTKRIFY